MLIAYRSKDNKKIILDYTNVGGGAERRLHRTLQSCGLIINQEHLVANTEKMDL